MQTENPRLQALRQETSSDTEQSIKWGILIQSEVTARRLENPFLGKVAAQNESKKNARGRDGCGRQQEQI